MARKPKLTNGYDQKQLETFLTEIDAADEALDNLRSAYMNRCKVPRSDIAGVFEAAKEAGIPVRALKTLVSNRRLDRRKAANIARLEADDADSYEGLVASLGDLATTPLGNAALTRDSRALDGLTS